MKNKLFGIRTSELKKLEAEILKGAQKVALKVVVNGLLQYDTFREKDGVIEIDVLGWMPFVPHTDWEEVKANNFKDHQWFDLTEIKTELENRAKPLTLKVTQYSQGGQIVRHLEYQNQDEFIIQFEFSQLNYQDMVKLIDGEKLTVANNDHTWVYELINTKDLGIIKAPEVTTVTGLIYTNAANKVVTPAEMFTNPTADFKVRLKKLLDYLILETVENESNDYVRGCVTTANAAKDKLLELFPEVLSK